jgi:acetyl esterase
MYVLHLTSSVLALIEIGIPGRVDAEMPGEVMGGDVTAEVYKHASAVDIWIYRFDPAGHGPKHDRRRAVVFFFGGGWNGGTVRQFEQHARYLAGRGMVAFLADYRVKSPHKAQSDACVADGKSAVRWIRARAQSLGIDPLLRSLLRK